MSGKSSESIQDFLQYSAKAVKEIPSPVVNKLRSEGQIETLQSLLSQLQAQVRNSIQGGGATSPVFPPCDLNTSPMSSLSQSPSSSTSPGSSQPKLLEPGVISFPPPMSNSLPITVSSLLLAQWIETLLIGPDQGAAIRSIMESAPQSVCGKILTHSDIAYKCLNCGADPTCVMCVDCFNRSDCRHHDYKMIRSGGGMCDCGDPTAWKPESFCSLHKGLKDDEDPTLHLAPHDRQWLSRITSSAVFLMVELTDLLLGSGSVNDSSLPEIILRMSSVLDFLASMSDCGKHLVVMALGEKRGGMTTRSTSPQLTSATTTTTVIAGPAAAVVGCTSNMDFLFEFDCHRPSSSIDWRKKYWTKVHTLIDLCLSDPLFKSIFARSFCVNYERCVHSLTKVPFTAENIGKQFATSCVQALTVPPVVNALMNPATLHLSSQTTLLHRLMMGLLYSLTLHERTPSSSNNLTVTNADAPFIMRVGPQSSISSRSGRDEARHKHFIYFMRYAFIASPQATAFFLSSRLLLRAWLFNLMTIEISNFICRDPDMTGTFFSYDVELSDTRTMWCMYDRLRQLGMLIRHNQVKKLLSEEMQALLRQCTHFSLDGVNVFESTASQGCSSNSSSMSSPVNSPNSSMVSTSSISVTDTRLPVGKKSTSPSSASVSPASVSLDSGGHIAQQQVWGEGLFDSYQDAIASNNLKFSPLIMNKSYTAILKRLRLPAGGKVPSLLQTTASAINPLSQMIAVFANMTEEILAHLKEVVSVTVAPQCKIKMRNSPFLEYDILQPQYSFTYNLPIHRFFVLVTKACLDVCGGMASPEVIQELFHIQRGISHMTDLVPILDLVIMIFVASGQIHDELWRRDFMDILRLDALRQRLYPAYFVECDLYLLQLACAAVGAHNVVCQLLARFSYTPPKDRFDAGYIPQGYNHFLQLVLEMVCDNIKSGQFDTDEEEKSTTTTPGNLQQKALYTRVVQRLAITPAAHSDVVEAVSKSDLDETANQAVFEEQLIEVLGAVANADQTRKGTVFSLKNTEAIWSQVNPYSCTWNHSALHVSKVQYRQKNSKKFEQVKDTKVYPCAHLVQHGPALHRPLMDILHTDATQSVAIFALLCFVHESQQRAAAAEKKTPADTKKKAEKQPDQVPQLQTGVLNKAVDLLYLAICDLKESNTNQFTGQIQWTDYVMSVQQNHNTEGHHQHPEEHETGNDDENPNENNNNTTSSTKIPSLPFQPISLQSGGLIHANLLAGISHYTVDVLDAESKKNSLKGLFSATGGKFRNCQLSFPSAMSGMDALQEIIKMAKLEGGAERLEILWKCEEIVSTVQNALDYQAAFNAAECDDATTTEGTESVGETMEEGEMTTSSTTTTTTTTEDAARKAKEKQAVALAKMKARQKKTKQITGESTSTAEEEEGGKEGGKKHLTQALSLHTAVREAAAEKECSFCQTDGEEAPLFLLCHTATSNVLSAIDGLKKPTVIPQKAKPKKQESTTTTTAKPKDPLGVLESEARRHGRRRRHQRPRTAGDESNDEYEEDSDDDDDDEEDNSDSDGEINQLQVDEMEDGSLPMNRSHLRRESKVVDLMCPDEITTHIHSCGHVVHATCLQKQVEYQVRHRLGHSLEQILMAGRGFRGIYFLHEAEILCPICGRIAKGVCSLPTTKTTKSAKVLVAATQAVREQFADMCYESSIGFSRTSDHKALKPIGEGQKMSSNEALLASLTAFAQTCRATIEAMKCSAEFTFRQYLALYSVFHTITLFPTERDTMRVIEKMLQSEEEGQAVGVSLTPSSEVPVEEDTSQTPPPATTTGAQSEIALQVAARCYSIYCNDGNDAGKQQDVFENYFWKALRCILRNEADTTQKEEKPTPIEEEEDISLKKWDQLSLEAKASIYHTVLLLSLLKLVILDEPLPSHVKKGKKLDENNVRFEEFIYPIGSGVAMSTTAQSSPSSQAPATDVVCDKVNVLVKYIFTNSREETPATKEKEECMAALSSAPSAIDHLLQQLLRQKEDQSSKTKSEESTCHQYRFGLKCLTSTTYRERIFSHVLFLPLRYTEMVTVASQAEANTCAVCHTRPQKPVICLMCKKLFCLKSNSPNKRGELVQHTRLCWGGTGVYLLVKQNLVLVLQAVNYRASQIDSPYVDKFGEPDAGLLRGVPLFLQKDKSQEFLLNWVMAQWDHDTVALRQTWKESLGKL